MAEWRQRLRRSGRLVALYRGLHGAIFGPPPGPTKATARGSRPTGVDHVAELRRVDLRRASVDTERINLIIPNVHPTATFGGVRTALDFFAALGERPVHQRILTLTPNDVLAQAALPDYRALNLDSDEDPPRALISLSDASPGSLAVGPRDRFVATFWTTAELAGSIRKWQAATYHTQPASLAYVIQDFEPGFYPWSAQYLLALETYGDHSRTIAVFNSSLLRDYFHSEGLRFEREFIFEPHLPAALRPYQAAEYAPRARQIVVYGRPSTPRNAFPLIMDGLRAWRLQHPGAEHWSIVSVGQRHLDVNIGAGMTVTSLGKLDLEAYAKLLRHASIGISLMVSPHPSYPPLEMAHMGLLTLTNRFGAKDLAKWHTNISSLDETSAGGIASRLSELCRQIEVDPSIGSRGVPGRPEYLSSEPSFPFAGEVAEALFANESDPRTEAPSA
jgi:O-antigen biosynthesis protein